MSEVCSESLVATSGVPSERHLKLLLLVHYLMLVPHHHPIVTEQAVALVVLYEFSSVAMIFEMLIDGGRVIEDAR